jgi:4-hydroxybenzoate polyprenyltransferase
MQQMAKLSAGDNFFLRIAAWSKERFPLANGVLSLVLFFAVAAVVRHAGAGAADLFSPSNWVGGVLVWSYFLVLRIFDEHKDYSIDMRNHPQRIIQSGIVKLSEIRALGCIVVVLQIAFSLYRGNGLGLPIYAWLAMFGFTALMGAEFFVGAWLQRHLLWYAASHMLVMPLIAVWSAALTGAQALDGNIALLAALFFCAGFAYEIGRKIRAPEYEIAAIETYSSVLGYKRAAYWVLVFALAFLAAAAALLPHQRQTLAVTLPLFSALYAYLAIKFLQFCRAPSAELSHSNEKLVGVYVICVLIALIVALAFAS